MKADVICLRCQAREASIVKTQPHTINKLVARWHCRVCGKMTCEHLCGFKEASMAATCTGCLIKGGHL